MANCGTSPSEQSIVIETCKEVKLPGTCPTPILGTVVLATATTAPTSTLTVSLPGFTLAVGQCICGPGIAEGTTIQTITAGNGVLFLGLSQPTTVALAAGTEFIIATAAPIAFTDLVPLFDSTQCGAPRFALIEVTNLGNCEVVLFSVTSFAVIPTSVVATVGCPLTADCSPTVQPGPGVTGINIVSVAPGQSVVLTSCDLVSLLSFCFSTVAPSPSTSPNFTPNGCDFTFSIKAFFCVPGCAGSNKSQTKTSSSTLTLVG